MTWFWLRVIDWLKPVYRWQGIDADQLRAIVGIKLVMDNRRAPAFRMQQTKKEHSTSFGLILFFYVIFGGLLSMLLAAVPSIVFSFSIYHSYLMVMVTLTLISDFSAILLDTSDNTIILPRPISAKTFYAARATHILLYIGQISLALAIIPIIVTFFAHGVALGLTLILTTILCVIFSVSLTNGLYLLMMRFTSEERLKSIINYFQIAMAIIMMGGYQILPRMLGISNLADVSMGLKWWALLVPPMWMTGLVKLVEDLSFESIDVIAACLALFIPVLSWKAINQYLAPYFTRKLTDLGTSSVPVPTVAASRTEKKSGDAFMARLLTAAGAERATFNLVSYIFSRDRKLKLRVYPALGTFAVLIVVFLFNKLKGDITLVEYIQSLKHTETHLFIIYACIFIVIAVGGEINFSEEYKAAWVFQAAPIQRPGKILLGTLKAIFARFFIPLYASTSIIVLLLWGERALPDLIFGMFACILLILSIFILFGKHMPLSLEPSARNQGESMARGIASIIVIGLLAFGHYLLAKLDLLVWLASPVLLIGCLLVLSIYKRLTWDDVEA
jgi:ABC-2 type transport system permease protein